MMLTTPGKSEVMDAAVRVENPYAARIRAKRGWDHVCDRQLAERAAATIDLFGDDLAD